MTPCRRCPQAHRPSKAFPHAHLPEAPKEPPADGGSCAPTSVPARHTTATQDQESNVAVNKPSSVLHTEHGPQGHMIFHFHQARHFAVCAAIFLVDRSDSLPVGLAHLV